MLTARKVALVDYNRCQPEKCAAGVCAAAQTCPAGLLRQDEPYLVPMSDPFSCRTCGDCVRACPLKAIQMTSI